MAGLIGFIHKIVNLLGFGRKHSAKNQRKSKSNKPAQSSLPLSDSERLQNLIKRDIRQHRAAAVAAAAAAKKQRLKRKRKPKSPEDLTPPALALPLHISQLDGARIEDIMLSAQIYEQGQEHQQDLKSAFLCYLTAAQKDFPPAKYKLAKMYEKGLSANLKPNYKQALAWMCQAAKQGLPEAMLDFAHYFNDGQMIAKDHALYVFWLTKAAHKGLIPAQKELSHLYLVGDIVEQDFDKAVEWLEIAEQQAQYDAEKAASSTELSVFKLEYAAGVTSQPAELGGLEAKLRAGTTAANSEVEPEVETEVETEGDLDAELELESESEFNLEVEPALEPEAEAVLELDTELGSELDAALEMAWQADMAAESAFDVYADTDIDADAYAKANANDTADPATSAEPEPAFEIESFEIESSEIESSEIESLVTQNPYNTSQHAGLDTAGDDTADASASGELSTFALGFNCTVDAALLYQHVGLDAYHSALMQQSLPLSFMAHHTNTRVFASDVELDELSFSPQLQSLLKQAQHGDVEAQLALAHKYLKGDGDTLKPNLTQAVSWLIQAVNHGSQQAQLLLGQLCFEQAALLDNTAQQHALLSFSAQNHYIPAQFKLGLMYLIGRDLTETEWADPQFVLDLAEQAAEPSFEPEDAAPHNGSNEDNRDNGVSAVYHEAWGAGAVNEFVPRGNTGVVKSHGAVATTGAARSSLSPVSAQPIGTERLEHAEGTAVTALPVLVKDVAQAVYWLERAAHRGLVPALTVLGLLYSRGKYCNWQRSFKCLQQAAQFSPANPFSTAAQLLLGQYFERGWGVAVNYAQALHWYEQAQASGSVPALVRLGWLYYHGNGVEQSFAQAYACFNQAAQSEDCTGQYALGLMYKHGYSVAQDYAQALALFQQAAAAHEKHALYELGQAYDLGRGVRVDNVLAWRYLEESAYLGCVKAQYALGCKYRDGKQQVSEFALPQEAASLGAPDIPRALFWFTHAAQHNSALAQYALGNIYQSGLGVEVDYEQAHQWFTRAVNQNYLAANISLGRLYEQGLGVVPDPKYAQELYTHAYQQGYRGGLNTLGWDYQHGIGVKTDIQEAIRLYEQAAAQGDASALNNLGWIYQKGIGVPADPDKAAELYQRAVNLNHLGAINNLAWLYQKGLGVKKDYAQALRLYHIAAERNYPNAKVSLGWMYEHGLGVVTDLQKAYEYYQQAADQNLPNALFYMGRCYEKGIGVKVDLSIAQDWYFKAASMGNFKASKALERLKRQQRRYGGF